MATTIVPLRNSFKMPVFDKRGVEIEVREYINTPFNHYYPEEPVSIIDWIAADNTRPSEEELAQPIEYKGVKYHGNYAWGSLVKMGKTIGLTKDIGAETKMFRNVEDAQRFQRWLLAQGTWGGLVAEGLKIGIVKPGTVIEGIGPVEDGFGYALKSVIDKGYNNLPKIRLGKAKGSYTMWQRIRPWTSALEAELIPLVMKRLEAMTEMKGRLYDQHSGWDEKKELYELDNELIYHPYIANALNRSSGELLARAATTVPLSSYMRLAVPTTCQNFCTEIDGKGIGLRYPIDADSSIQAFDAREENPDLLSVERARIAKMEAVQLTTANKDVMIKHVVGLVDSLPNNWDMIICTEDVKMASSGKNEITNLPEFEFSGVIVYTQWFAAGSCAGVSAKWAKDTLGLDHDGDMIELADASSLPVLWQTVKSLPPSKTSKLKKTHRLLETADLRVEMIKKSMSNLVGFASNVVSDSFTVEDRAFLSTRLGFSGEAELNSFQNFLIKAGTDGFKTDIDLVAIEKQTAAMQSNQNRLLKYGAPWTGWPNEDAFRHGAPVIIDQYVTVEENGKVMEKYVVDGEIIFLTRDQLKNAVHPHMDGTVAHICRLTLPHLKNIIGETVTVYPLTAFRNWAPEVDDDTIEAAKAVQDWYNANQGRVVWTDPKSIGAFKLRLMREIQVWIERDGIDTRTAASALWRVAHSSRSRESGGASVFIAFPEEVRWIVAEKPGTHIVKPFHSIVTGIHYQIPNLLEANNLKVEVVDVHINVKGKALIRKAIVGRISDAQRQPQNMMYPADMIGMIAENADQPEVGRYVMNIKQYSQASWNAWLTPIEL